MLKQVMPEHKGSVIWQYRLRLIGTQVTVLLLVSCAGRSPELQEMGPMASDKPLATFVQSLSSTQTTLAMRPSEVTAVPVTIRNVSCAVLDSNGRYPITLSYKWLDGGEILPLEGERTFLRVPLKVGDQQTLLAKVRAPDGGSTLTLRFSLVQEAVAWFVFQGAQPLDIPARLVP